MSLFLIDFVPLKLIARLSIVDTLEKASIFLLAFLLLKIYYHLDCIL